MNPSNAEGKTYRVPPCRHERARIELLQRLAQDLIEAIKAQDPELIGNDLGNAIGALEDELYKSSKRTREKPR